MLPGHQNQVLPVCHRLLALAAITVARNYAALVILCLFPQSTLTQSTHWYFRSRGTEVDTTIHRVTSDSELARDILMSLPGVDLTSAPFEGNFDSGCCEVSFSCESAFFRMRLY